MDFHNVKSTSQFQVEFRDLNAELPFLTKADQRQYAQAFQDSGHTCGYLGGDCARMIFLKSGLSSDHLSRIWDLSDIDSNGYLTFSEFSVAMFLINAKRRGVEVPIHLPENIYRQLKKNLCADYKYLWAIEKSEQESYKKLFHTNRAMTITTEGDETPFGPSTPRLERYEAERIFAKSRLPPQIIDMIWILADVDHDNRLDEEEFCVAMALISRQLKGELLPDQLPEELFPPSHRTFVREETMLDRQKWRKQQPTRTSSSNSSSSNSSEKRYSSDMTTLATQTDNKTPLLAQLETLKQLLTQSEQRIATKKEQEAKNRLRLASLTEQIDQQKKAITTSTPSITRTNQQEDTLRQMKHTLDHLRNQLLKCKSDIEQKYQPSSTDQATTTAMAPIHSQILELQKEIRRYEEDESQYAGLSEADKIAKKGAAFLAKRMAELKLKELQQALGSSVNLSGQEEKEKGGYSKTQQLEQLKHFQKILDELQTSLSHFLPTSEESHEKSKKSWNSETFSKENKSFKETTIPYLQNSQVSKKADKEVKKESLSSSIDDNDYRHPQKASHGIQSSKKQTDREPSNIITSSSASLSRSTIKSSPSLSMVDKAFQEKKSPLSSPPPSHTTAQDTISVPRTFSSNIFRNELAHRASNFSETGNKAASLKSDGGKKTTIEPKISTKTKQVSVSASSISSDEKKQQPGSYPIDVPAKPIQNIFESKPWEANLLLQPKSPNLKSSSTSPSHDLSRIAHLKHQLETKSPRTLSADMSPSHSKKTISPSFQQQQDRELLEDTLRKHITPIPSIPDTTATASLTTTPTMTKNREEKTESLFSKWSDEIKNNKEMQKGEDEVLNIAKATSLTVSPALEEESVQPSSRIVVALYDFTARDMNELSFSAGDHLEVYEQWDEAWYRGELNGKQGLFPINYVAWEDEEEQKGIYDFQKRSIL
jgi:hypothetical protein